MPTLQELLPQVAAHLGTSWRAIVADVSADAVPSWADEHVADLSGPHGWQLHIHCRDSRMTVTGMYAGHSIATYISAKCINEIGVSMERPPRAIALDIRRRLLTKDYPTLFERARTYAQTAAEDDARDRATMERLMSLDPASYPLYYSTREAVIYKQHLKLCGAQRVEFDRLQVSEAQAIMILRIVGAGQPQR